MLYWLRTCMTSTRAGKTHSVTQLQSVRRKFRRGVTPCDKLDATPSLLIALIAYLVLGWNLNVVRYGAYTAVNHVPGGTKGDACTNEHELTGYQDCCGTSEDYRYGHGVGTVWTDPGPSHLRTRGWGHNPVTTGS